MLDPDGKPEALKAFAQVKTPAEPDVG